MVLYLLFHPDECLNLPITFKISTIDSPEQHTAFKHCLCAYQWTIIRQFQTCILFYHWKGFCSVNSLFSASDQHKCIQWKKWSHLSRKTLEIDVFWHTPFYNTCKQHETAFTTHFIFIMWPECDFNHPDSIDSK